MKKRILIAVGAIGVFLGLFGSWVTYEGLHRTSDDKFCIVCHEMTPMVSAYHDDVHGGAGESGFKASCVSCHIATDNVFHYIYTKAKNGAVEGAIHFFGDVDAIDWHERRTHRDKFVVDSGCISCHSNYKTNEYISKKGLQLHAHYDALLGTDKQIGCASCHVETGHKGLKNTLNYYKPQYEFYEGKFEAEKEAIEKRLAEKFK